MFGKFSEQVKKSSKPVSSLVAVNTKALEELSQQQTEFFTGFLADSVKYVESLSVLTEVKGFVAAQSTYAEAVKERLAHTSKQTYGTMNDIREEYTKVLKTSIEELPAAEEVTKELMKAVPAVATPTAPKAETKPAPVKKPAAKKAAPKAPVKAAAKAPVKAAAKAPVKAAAKAPAKAEAPKAKPAEKPAARAEAPKAAKTESSPAAPAAAKKA
ncbi:phasin family protein [Alteromonas sp. LMIT006]|uniref:TIGR01841 family phasin n=1 Tax=Alteromonadaceae TaxID=72275 RepID=UPI0020CA87C6|nr:TIGR01841 family phasin [Alteromonas sp. LMIT006]UTP72977.1 phasin family protein [Alteromonas sp. LMIT006]